jgi:hypothetical protein
MFIISTTTSSPSGLQLKALWIAAKENKQVTDIKEVYRKLQTYAEFTNDIKYLEMVEEDIVVKHYETDKGIVLIKEVNQ